MEYASICVAAFMIGFLLIGFIRRYRSKDAKLRNKIESGKFIGSNEFYNHWIIERGKVGYKYMDTPGCYIILIFDKPVRRNNFHRYKEVYIGQSIHVMERVRQHFTGHGNGDVYADIKYGKSVYVRIVPCKKNGLNKMEKNLIRAFHATESYNPVSYTHLTLPTTSLV